MACMWFYADGASAAFFSLGNHFDGEFPIVDVNRAYYTWDFMYINCKITGPCASCPTCVVRFLFIILWSTYTPSTILLARCFKRSHRLFGTDKLGGANTCNSFGVVKWTSSVRARQAWRCKHLRDWMFEVLSSTFRDQTPLTILPSLLMFWVMLTNLHHKLPWNLFNRFQVHETLRYSSRLRVDHRWCQQLVLRWRFCVQELWEHQPIPLRFYFGSQVDGELAFGVSTARITREIACTWTCYKL